MSQPHWRPVVLRKRQQQPMKKDSRLPPPNGTLAQEDPSPRVSGQRILQSPSRRLRLPSLSHLSPSTVPCVSFLEQLGPKEKGRLLGLVKDLALAQEKESSLQLQLYTFNREKENRDRELQELVTEKAEAMEVLTSA